MAAGKYLPEANPGPAEDIGTTIKTLYESKANTNAFTNTEQTKLAGIEENVTAGGEAAMAAHLAADDPHGDRAYAYSLVFPPAVKSRRRQSC